MLKVISAIVVAAAFLTSAQAADLRAKRQTRVIQQQQTVQVRPVEPLRQIPIVGTVVYGGLDYAGRLILSPFELLGGPRR